MEQAPQGEGNKGKIRLTAKNGLYKDTAANRRYLDLEPVMSRVQVPLTAQTIADVQTVKDRLDTGDYSVRFDVSPEITEQGSASYGEISDIRAPASIMWYQGSPSRTFSINAKFLARTQDEAYLSARYIHRLKSWRMPEDVSFDSVGLEPPTLLYLQGYLGIFKNIPVVMTDITIEYTSEHDYIKSSGDEFAIPVITSVNISLKEAHSLEGKDLKGNNPDSLNSFNILDYRLGKLKGW